ELGINPKIATLYSSQQPEQVADAFSDNRVKPLEPAPDISTDSISQCSHIVALAGAEQINEAIETGADIILAGRTTDTAIIAALPLARGVNPGTAWHGAKIAECGALCSTNPTSGVIVVDFHADAFEVRPMADNAVCTPHSVSAHMLYENADPFLLHEPGGSLDVTHAQYESVTDAVRVTGSTWTTAEQYTVKLEGASLAGYQTTILAMLRDQRYVDNADAWIERLQTFLQKEIQERMSLSSADYDLEFRLMGKNSVLGDHETRTGTSVELGVLGIITAKSAETAEEIGKLINPFVLHYPLTDNEELPTFAFPYSPAQSERGALYEFSLNHTLVLEQPMDVFRLCVQHANDTVTSIRPAAQAGSA
ncbi:MAG: DUF1446 domain-containing protein, partial [Gammaproteobacteria bacterium]|nr:DUF1446 domain-containing protein [Gammaproteobacteria bacterium]